MINKIEAVYEQGMFRPLQPLALPEGTLLNLIVISREQGKNKSDAAKILAEIAALPLEGSGEVFLAREQE